MTTHPSEAVIAGSRAFAVALLAPLTQRIGLRPRIAAEPGQALALTGGAGLLVFEFQGAGSLGAIREVLAQAGGLAVVAGVPAGLAGAEEELRALGVEPARWDGTPDGVLAAVGRRLAVLEGGAPDVPAAPELAPAPPAPSAPPAARAAPPPPPVPAAAGALFDDVAFDEGAADGLQPLDAAPLLSAPVTAAGEWPSAVPGAPEAADALGRGLQGEFAPAGAPLAVVADVMAGMPPLERAVLVGEPQPFDVEPIRRAAVMRVRVAVALATAPQGPGAPVDAAAVSELLADIDGLLSDVNGLLAAAPAELQPALEQVRNALVKEAIDFSEVAHRVSSGEVAPAAPTPAEAEQRAAARRAAGTRLLAIESEAERAAEREASRKRVWLWAVLALAVAGGAVFHGERFLQRRAATVRATGRTGAPADATVLQPTVPGAPIVIRGKDGRALTADEAKRIEETESLRGNTVRVERGTAIVLPGAIPGGVPVPPAPPAGGAAAPPSTQGGGAPGAAPPEPAR